MEAIDKVRDTSTSHERCSIIEVMGRNAGYLAVWCGIANGAEDILIPEKYDYDEQKLIDNIVESRKKGKKHHIIVNAEGIGHSEAMAKRIEAATGIETRATILGHMQRGGNPTCKDRVYASMMGALAVDLLVAGKRSRVVGYRHGEFVDFDINEALAMQKNVDSYMWRSAILFLTTTINKKYELEKVSDGLHKLNTSQIIALGFAGVIFVGGLILWMPFCSAPGQAVTFPDAVFTAATSVCV